MNKNFTDHVTGIAFSLSLSKNQIAVFHDIARGYIPQASHAISAMRKLDGMGLVYAKDPTLPGRKTLTTEGKLVYQLIKAAGLVERMADNHNRLAS